MTRLLHAVDIFSFNSLKLGTKEGIEGEIIPLWTSVK